MNKVVLQEALYLGVGRAPVRGIRILTENIEGEISTKYEIQKHLMDDQVGMIGVCGIGGVGKTTIMKHINNDLLRDDRFQKVIWVTVSYSYPLNVFELQKKIVDAMHETLQEVEEMRRAAELTDIMGRKSFVLILDDVWDNFSLMNVGIPEPVQNKSKVVITTRSIEVCKSLDCQIVKVQPLSPEESLNLFLEKVGRDVLQKVSGLEETLKLIVEECDGLPLAIVVIAGSLKGEDDIAEWRNALNELRLCVRSVKYVEDAIFGRLRFSYDRLRSPEIQQCFLYCSLFREDYEFVREELIEEWIDEGLIVVDQFKRRGAAYDRGHAILNQLLQNCLLEECVEKTVKMHDVVRDMAIKSIGPGCGYLVKAGMKLEEVPNESEWVGDLKKVSLIANDISKIPAGLSPKCPLLSTLILSNNPTLSGIPTSFFESMVRLKVLDLSSTGICVLPKSISNLVNLSALRLRNCKHLVVRLPSFEKLVALKKLDLYETKIAEVPQGMEMLVNLQYLDLYCRYLTKIPTGILHNLSRLQCLVLYPSKSAITQRIHIEEVARLSNLEGFKCRMEVQDFNLFVNKFKDFQRLTAYEFRLTTGEREIASYGLRNFYQRKVLIAKCEIGEECLVLPDTLEYLWISDCENKNNMRRSLNKIVLLENATELKWCFIDESKGIECIVELDSFSSSLCCQLEQLDLKCLPNLSALMRVEGVATPPHIFSNLKKLGISNCSAMRKLVPLELWHAFQNLESIIVSGCRQMEEIIASSDSDTSSSNKFSLTFPKLQELTLVELDQLKSICSDEAVMVCDSIEQIEIRKCPKLKRIPLQLPLLDNGQPSPPPHLRQIGIKSKEWWESVVELDHPNAKNILQPFLKFR
ncbi:hypothetical protein SLE2022_317930 [Rubroshorea leprosula]